MVLAVLAMAGCAGFSHGQTQSVLKTLETFGRQTSRVSYDFGACTWSRMDCSCFVQRLFAEKFGRILPRTTLSQVSFMARDRVAALDRPHELNDRNLCPGDLIYTYNRGTWSSGSRHVVVYTGNDRVLHSSRKNRGVGYDRLDWVRRYNLQGVYRPLGCSTGAGRPPSRNGDGRSPRARTVHPTRPKRDDNRSVRDFIARYYRNWETRNLEEYRRLWSPEAVRWNMGRQESLRTILEKRRKEVGTLLAARQEHEIVALGIWGDHAMLDVVYSLELTYSRHRREQSGLMESFILERSGDGWRIAHNESFRGD